MTAYIIFIKEETHNQHELDLYAEKMGGMVADLPATFLSAYGQLEVLEGPVPEGIVLASFPTFEQATTWYHSEAYQSIVKHRHKGATYRGFIVGAT